MLTTAPTSNNEIQTVYVARIDELKKQQRESGYRCKVEYSNPPQFTAFFVVVFVFGLVMSQWALLSGHVAAWVAGLVFSVSGVSVALHSLFASLRERDQHINDEISRHNRLATLGQRRHPLATASPHFSNRDSSKVRV